MKKEITISTCKICNKTCDKFAMHLRLEHKIFGKDKLEEYYLKYISETHIPEVCNLCNTKKNFVGPIKGYSKKICKCITEKTDILGCCLCNKKLKSNKALALHLKYTHKYDKLQVRKYYDEFLLKNDSNLCSYNKCKKPTEYIDFSLGYNQLCNECQLISGVRTRCSKNYWIYRFNKSEDEAIKLAYSYNPFTYEYYERIYGKDIAVQKFNEICNKNSDEFWLSRGYNQEEIGNLRVTSQHKKYWLNRGYSEEEASIQIKKSSRSRKEYWMDRGYNEEEANNKVRSNNIRCKEYWLNQGCSEKEAIEKVKANSAFSVQFWINKGYTKKQAYNKIKSQNSIYEEYWTSKDLDPKNRNSKFYLKTEYWKKRGYTEDDAIKMVSSKNPYSNRSWSMISQNLFWSIVDNIDNKNLTFVFASNDGSNIKPENYNTNINHEYVINTKHLDYPHDFLKVDFYIPELNIAIEFDGSYWHRYNNDEQNDKDTKRLKIYDELGIKYLIINESDFNKNKQDIINKCICFINSHKQVTGEIQ